MPNIMKNDYLIYMHVKVSDGIPFYIGKGKMDRAHTKRGRSKWWYKTVNKHKFKVVILEDNLNEIVAFKKEIEYITKYGRKDLGLGSLVNMTNGGEGFSGEHTKETKNKISKSMLGEANHFYGKKHTKEVREISSKLVLDTINGIFYDNCKDAAKIYGYAYSSLSQKLCGSRKNNTNLIYV